MIKLSIPLIAAGYLLNASGVNFAELSVPGITCKQIGLQMASNCTYDVDPRKHGTNHGPKEPEAPLPRPSPKLLGYASEMLTDALQKVKSGGLEDIYAARKKTRDALSVLDHSVQYITHPEETKRLEDKYR